MINRIADFETGINSLHNPSFLSYLSSIPQASSFWKWGALILALVATFTSVINRVKVLILSFRKIHYGSPSEPLLVHFEDESFSDGDDECSSYSSSEDEEDNTISPCEHRQPVDEDFRVAGSSLFNENFCENGKCMLRRLRSVGDLFSWSEFASSKSVVKLWDGLGLGLDLNRPPGNIISIYDFNREQNICSFFGEKCPIPAVTFASPSMIVSAGENTNASSIGLKVWDLRIGRKVPAMLADWQSQRAQTVGSINVGGVDKLYVTDHVTGRLTVGDLRNVTSPLENMTESDSDTWWDADVVIRCRDAVRSVFFQN